MPSLIGNKPNQVPSNGDLGTLAFQDANAVKITGGAIDVSTLNTTGNVGIGVTPSAWSSSWRVVDINRSMSVFSFSGASNFGGVSNNAYADSASFTTGGVYKYDGSAGAYFQSTSGNHIWSSAPSGTAGNSFTWTQILSAEKDKSLALQGAVSQTGTGITFPATQSASSDANTLDDYEEGTWTPTLTGFSGTGLTADATYTKIGRVVYCAVAITPSSGDVTGSSMQLTQPFSGAKYGTGTWITGGGGQTGGIQAVPFGNTAVLSGSISATNIVNLGWFIFT
jgi:hypothetical protein